MDVFECIESRRSVRSYQDRPVEEEKVQRVLEAGRRAPSANNRQNWKFIVVRDPDMRRELARAAHGQTFVAEAPVVIVPCATQTEYVMACGHPSHLVDLAIVIDHMTLAARAQGLGTCWIGSFDQDEAKKLLGVPDSAAVIELLPLGYPAAWPSPTSRKPLQDVVCHERWA